MPFVVKTAALPLAEKALASVNVLLYGQQKHYTNHGQRRRQEKKDRQTDR